MLLGDVTRKALHGGVQYRSTTLRRQNGYYLTKAPSLYIPRHASPTYITPLPQIPQIQNRIMSASLAQSESPNSTEKHAQEQSYEQQELQEPQEDVTPKRTFGQKAKRHCARFWWIHVIVFCLIVMIVTLLVVYVGFPKIAQQDVDDSSLEFREGSFTNPTSNSIRITQEATLHNPSTFKPTLDEFPADLYLVTNGTYGAEKMLTLPMPSIHARKRTNSSIDADVPISSVDQVSAYAVTVMTNEYVTTALVGKTKLRLGKLPVQTVTFNSTSTYKGLNSLKGFNTTDLLFDLTAKAGMPNLLGNAQIPNPSLMTLVLGNVTLDLSIAEAGVVGNVTINDFVLRPGANTLPMSAIIEQPKVLASLDAAGKVNLTITGKSSVYNGQHLTYYEKALASNVMVLEMNVKQILADSTAAATAQAAASK
ncbi:hypothetical protein LZ554_005807 [Drepanopeziza brunnea f. sp. 'monogermtubi']|nr:hypothetical protein LZ554_005807 [Drepanopeziza brunnea f. sp. 'monogermtubi']